MDNNEIHKMCPVCVTSCTSWCDDKKETPQLYENRGKWIWLDGKLLKAENTNISLHTHALHYASAVFEGERAYGGKIFKLKEHSQRLINSAKIMGIPLKWSLDTIMQATESIVSKNNIINGYIRPLVWSGPEDLAIGTPSLDGHLAIMTWDWVRSLSEEEDRDGVRLCWAKWRRPSPNTAPWDAKASGLYMIATMSKNEAVSQGYYDALMLDYRGYVAESTSANIFFVIGDTLYTPIADCFLNGITRQTIIEIATFNGIKCMTNRFYPENLEFVQEAFLCGTAAEITFIRQIGGYNFTPGKISNFIKFKYAETVGKCNVHDKWPYDMEPRPFGPLMS